MKKLTVILLSVFFGACSPNQASQLAEIQKLEQSASLSTREGLNKLAQLHKEYGLRYIDSTANNYLYAAGQHYFFERDTHTSITLLSEYILRDDSSNRYRNATVNLALLYAKNNNYTTSVSLINALIDNTLPTPAQWQDIIKLYEQIITDTSITTNPKDYETLSMAYTAVGRFIEATQTLDTAIEKFPTYQNRNNLIYRAGFIAWEYMADIPIAKNFYTQFLAEYPDDEKAGEVHQILNSGMLEMSDEDILTMLKGQ